MRELLAAFVGGIIGTALRYGADALIPHTNTTFPVSTLLVNVIGSFLLAVLVARVWSHASSWLRAGLGTGLVGSFTTFSAVMVSVVAQAASGLWILAVGYLILSLALGFGAAALGLRLGRRIVPIDWVDE